MIRSCSVFDHWPAKLLDCHVSDLETLIGPSALFYLKGKRGRPIFVSTLLHGNEHSGFYGLQRLLKLYGSRELPRPMIIFLGNNRAASRNLRHLPNQVDFNRIWQNYDGPESELVEGILNVIDKEKPVMAIDIHNNTGKNPHYGCISSLAPEFKTLANLFSRTSVYFTEPKEALSVRLTSKLPSITIECGLSGEERGTNHVMEFVRDCLHLDKLDHHKTPKRDLQIFHTVARIRITKQTRVGFKPSENLDMILRDDIDNLNFTELTSSGVEIGSYSCPHPPIVVDSHINGYEASHYFKFANGKIYNRGTWIPSMFTKDIEVMTNDCLGYIMEPIKD